VCDELGRKRSGIVEHGGVLRMPPRRSCSRVVAALVGPVAIAVALDVRILQKFGTTGT
jgi:hypothetical protein